MKLLYFRVPNRKEKTRKPRKINMERFLFLSFLIAFFALVMVQGALVNPSVRTFLTMDTDYEGTALGVEETLYKEGEICIALSEQNQCEGLKVLVNGSEAAAFTNSSVTLKVKDGDVVEIDGSAVDKDMGVAILSMSENIVSDAVGKIVHVQSNIKMLTKIVIE